VIILCSFWTVPEGFTPMSVARRLPDTMEMTQLKFLAPFDTNGEAIMLRSFNSPEGYYRTYFEGLEKRREVVTDWYGGLRKDVDVALCCWCNSRFGKAREQVDEHGTFVCHTALVGMVLKKYRKDLEVRFDNDREKYSYWRM